MSHISVIGAGGWGTALAIQAAKSHEVLLWSHSEEEAQIFRSHQENIFYLPGISIPSSIEISCSKTKVAQSGIVIFVPPSAYFRQIALEFKDIISPESILVSATKGFEFSTDMLMTEVLSDVFPHSDNIVALSGPSHAEEVARDVPSSVVVASTNMYAAIKVQEALSNDRFRLYSNSDVLGVQISAALKNVIAIAAGMLRGLGFGDNTMAMLVTRGLAEIRRMGLAMGAQADTFAGLAGMGDLIVTCMSPHSRNGRLGEALSRGISLKEYMNSSKMVAEGTESVKSAIKLQEEYKVDMPISEAVYKVLYEDIAAQRALEELMERPLKQEWD